MRVHGIPTTTAVIAAAIAVACFGHGARGQAIDKVSFGTAWLAEAEHGGFYQAVADGT
jgi:hypothetical protein